MAIAVAYAEIGSLVSLLADGTSGAFAAGVDAFAATAAGEGAVRVAWPGEGFELRPQATASRNAQLKQTAQTKEGAGEGGRGWEDMRTTGHSSMSSSNRSRRRHRANARSRGSRAGLP